MLCCFSNKTPAAMLADQQLYASEEIGHKMEEGVRRYLEGEPLPYILEEWDFFGMTLKVTKDTLIPRDDSMAVTELALEAGRSVGEMPRVLDLCTGTGCIGLAVAKQLPGARVTLADVSSAALSVAKQNVQRMKLGSRVSCILLDVRQDPPVYLKNYDIIVSNPPYITDSEMKELPDSVRLYEPELALRAGQDGLMFYHAITEHYKHVLNPDGFLCYEFGMGQETDVGFILENNGFRILKYRKDERGITRAVLAQRKGEN